MRGIAVPSMVRSIATMKTAAYRAMRMTKAFFIDGYSNSEGAELLTGVKACCCFSVSKSATAACFSTSCSDLSLELTVEGIAGSVWVSSTFVSEGRAIVEYPYCSVLVVRENNIELKSHLY